MRQSILHTEVLIVGGGLAGLTLAAYLGSAGIHVICLERAAPSQTTKPQFDGRTTAIAAGPRRVLEACGIWSKLVKQACPILDIRVADQDASATLDFHHSDIGTEPFGWIVENHLLRQALWQRARTLPTVKIMAPAVMQKLNLSHDEASLTLTDGRTITAQLIIGADGRNSACREQAGIPTYGWHYQQTAMVCTVAHSLPHDNIAVEHFLPGGPLATLPMLQQRSSVVWSEKTATAAYLMSLSEKDFTAALQDKIGDWLGTIKLAGPRFEHPLNLRHAQRYTATRFALINEAAHGIHPIAGQGLNLGMRDIAVLGAELSVTARLGLDLGNPELLRRYEQKRKLDNGTMVLTTDLLVRLFSNAIPPVQAVRRFGLGLVEQITPAKHFFMRQAMGGGAKG